MSACNANWSARRQGTVANLMWGIGALCFGLVLIQSISWIAIVLAGVGAILILMTWFRSFQWRRFFREAKKYNDDISVTVDDNLVHVETAEGKSDLNWNFFSWYLDTPEYILLYTTKRNFSVIPRSAFKRSQDFQSLLHLVESKLKRIR